MFDLHYAANRHHPEHYALGIDDMDLIDMIEMVCDWISYKKDITIREAIDMIDIQGTRYNMSTQLMNILKNTIFNHFSTLVEQSKSYPDLKTSKDSKHLIDISV